MCSRKNPIRLWRRDSPSNLSRAPLSVQSMTVGYGQRRSSGVSSYSLMPRMQGASLSLSQKARRLFHTSKIPSFSYNVTVEMPTIIRLENPTPIPVLIHPRPRWEQTSGIVRDCTRERTVNLEGIRHATVRTLGIPPPTLRSKAISQLLVIARLDISHGR